MIPEPFHGDLRSRPSPCISPYRSDYSLVYSWLRTELPYVNTVLLCRKPLLVLCAPPNPRSRTRISTLRVAVRTVSFRFFTVQRQFHSVQKISLQNKVMDHESYIKGFYHHLLRFFCNNKPLIDGLKIIERFFTLPLDYSNPNGEKIRVFARHVISKKHAKTLEDEAKLPFRKPRLVPSSRFILSIV